MDKTYTISPFNQSKFADEIKDSSLASKHFATTGLNSADKTFHFNADLTAQEQTDLDAFIAAHDGSPSSDLKVFRYLSRFLDPKTSDFTIIGLRKVSPLRDRGRKREAEYRCPSDDSLVVKKIFTDVVPSAELLNISCKFDWYDENGDIALTKTETVKEYSKDETETVYRERRSRQMDYLKGSVKGTALETGGNYLWARYATEISLYEGDGTLGLDTVIDNETDTTALAVLDTYVPRNDDSTKPISVRQAIKYQMGTITIAQIETDNANVTWPPA